jgi:D-alanine transaminase/branched-chain amino acid aminotransferase
MKKSKIFILSMYTYLNDSFVPASEAALGVSDLAIQRGYGIFDYFKTIDGKPIFLDDHLDRFFHSAGRMRLDVGHTRDMLTTILAELISRNGISDSGIRITLTGGLSPDGISPGRPNLVITQHPLAPPGRQCVAPVRLVSYPHQRQLPDIKTIDYLMAIHLQPYVLDRGAFDVLYHRNRIITECPRRNFFIVTAKGALATPADHILKGITRKHVLKLAAAAGLPVGERDIRLDELRSAREAFITSTSLHVVPVSHVDGIPIGIPHERQTTGALQAGPIAGELNAGLYQLATSGNL